MPPLPPTVSNDLTIGRSAHLRGCPHPPLPKPDHEREQGEERERETYLARAGGSMLPSPLRTCVREGENRLIHAAIHCTAVRMHEGGREMADLFCRSPPHMRE
jgi:hypothetical protein